MAGTAFRSGFSSTNELVRTSSVGGVMSARVLNYVRVEELMIRKIVIMMLIASGLVACRAHVRAGPVHAGGGIADHKS